jgi:hypothetical protein
MPDARPGLRVSVGGDGIHRVSVPEKDGRQHVGRGPRVRTMVIVPLLKLGDLAAAITAEAARPADSNPHRIVHHPEFNSLSSR